MSNIVADSSTPVADPVVNLKKRLDDLAGELGIVGDFYIEGHDSQTGARTITFPGLAYVAGQGGGPSHSVIWKPSGVVDECVKTYVPPEGGYRTPIRPGDPMQGEMVTLAVMAGLVEEHIYNADYYRGEETHKAYIVIDTDNTARAFLTALYDAHPGDYQSEKHPYGLRINLSDETSVTALMSALRKLVTGQRDGEWGDLVIEISGYFPINCSTSYQLRGMAGPC